MSVVVRVLGAGASGGARLAEWNSAPPSGGIGLCPIGGLEAPRSKKGGELGLGGNGGLEAHRSKVSRHGMATYDPRPWPGPSIPLRFLSRVTTGP